MNVISAKVEREIEPTYGHASGPCIDPPEKDFRVEYWTAIVQLDEKETVEDVKELLSDKVEVYDRFLLETELPFYLDLLQVEIEGPNDRNQLTIKVRVQDSQPCRQWLGTYEKVMYYPR